MANSKPIRKILADSKAFKQFWQDSEPFLFALTSREFPPVLLGPEEWVFSNDLTELFKELMQYRKKKMKIIKAPFNPGSKKILRPENLSEWKINHFPEEWNGAACDLFTPEGHLTVAVLQGLGSPKDSLLPDQVEDAFFACLETRMEQLGYLLFKAQGTSKRASIQSYLSEWEKDEKEAGFI